MVWTYASIGKEPGKLRVLPKKTLAPVADNIVEIERNWHSQTGVR